MIKRIKRPLAMNILLADDDADDRGLFIDAVGLINESIDVSCVKDGEELMTFLENQSSVPDIIFLDLNMPKKNGRECLAEITSKQPLHHIPVIIYSTSLNRIDIEETFANGAAFFFRKPNSFEELKDGLQKLLTSEIFHSFRTRRIDEFVLNGHSVAAPLSARARHTSLR